jgi:ABC-2 type transport system ATP-binding protein
MQIDGDLNDTIVNIMNDIKITPPAVTLNQIKVAYGKKRVIDHFSLSINPGDHTALLGIKGSGKTTLINVMMGLIRPTGGQALAAGFDCWKQSLEVRRRCGYVPAVPVYDKDYSINDLLNFSAGLGRGNADWDLVQSLVDRFHLDPRKRIALINPMEIKLTGFILGFMTHPEIVFLDEPYTGLDDEGSEIVNAFLEELKPRGQTLIAALTHPSQSGQVFKEIALIRGGNLVSVVKADKLAGQTVRKVEIKFGAKPLLEKLIKSGMIRQLSWEGTTLRCFVIGPSGQFLKAIDGNEVLDIKSWEADLEETIQVVYMEEENAS